MTYSLSELIVLFFTYSVIGWLWETIYCSLKDGHYDYLGFLFGPYCPVYGFAVTTILVFTATVQDNLLLLFIVGLIVSTVFEYCASLFLEKAFHMVLWDYSHLWGNIQGRVAPVISLFWGVGVVLLVKFVQPQVQKAINWEEQLTHVYFALIVAIGMITDFILTMISVHRFHITTKMWNERIQADLDKKKLEVKDLRAEVLKNIDAIRPTRRLSWNHRRLARSFADLRFKDTGRLNTVKKELLKRKPFKYLKKRPLVLTAGRFLL